MIINNIRGYKIDVRGMCRLILMNIYSFVFLLYILYVYCTVNYSGNFDNLIFFKFIIIIRL